MRSQSRHPDQSGRIAGTFFSCAVTAALLLIVSACGPAPRRDGGEGNAETGKRPSRAELASLGRDLVRFKDALLLYGSPDPVDWKTADLELKKIYPMCKWGDDWQLVRRMQRGEEADLIRQELYERGRVLDAALLFAGSHDPVEWKRSFEDVLSLGAHKTGLLVDELFGLLLNQHLNDRHVHYRSFLVESGKPALELSRALAREMADRLDDGPLADTGSLRAVLSVMICFGDLARKDVLDLFRHRNHHVRRAVCDAVAMMQDCSFVADAGRLLREDPAWQVRQAAAAALGGMSVAPDEAGPLLLAGLTEERDETVRDRIIIAIGECRHGRGVPALMELLEEGDAALERRVIRTLRVITGLTLRTRGEWGRWYKQEYASWIRKQEDS